MNIAVDRYLNELSRDDTKRLSEADYLKDIDLNVYTIDKGIVIPPKVIGGDEKIDDMVVLWGRGGVTDREHNYIEESAQRAKGMKQRIYGSYEFSDSDVKYVDEPVIYMNFFFGQWGHFLLDVIGRLWYTLRENSDCKIVYTNPYNVNTRISGNYLEFLKLLGISEDRLLMVNEITQFRQVILPQTSVYPGWYYTKEYKEMFDTVVRNSGAGMSKENKIYCSRALFEAARAKEANENLVEEVFLENGYSPVYMEKLSLTDQIKTLNSSSHIAFISGSVAHNLLFVRNGAHVTILNKTYRYNIHQFMINQIARADACYTDVYVSPDKVLYGVGPFIIKITPRFYNYCVDNGLRLDKNKVNVKLTVKERIDYRKKWLKLNKFYIITLKGLSEGDPENEKSRREIRRYFRKQQKM